MAASPQNRNLNAPAMASNYARLPGLALFVCAALVFPVASGKAQKDDPREFHMTLAGDAIMVTPATPRQQDPGFMGVVKAVRRGDAALMNFEGTFAGKESYPVYDTGGTWIASDPERLKDLQWIGFNLFSAANNHSVDFGTRGLLDTIDVFHRYGASFAGIGENLGEARAPGYVTTPHGRVALISVAATFSVEAPAGDARPDMRGRPGESVLRHQTAYVVDPATLETFRKMKQNSAFGISADGGNSAQSVKLAFDGGAIAVQAGDKPGVITTPDPQDVAELTHSIRDAREQADYVVAFMHAHEQVPGNVEIPAQFVVEFAHAAIDAGADVFAASGPHVLRGIEIYKGKLILYSLGNFIFENDLVTPQPSDLYQTFGLGFSAAPSEVFDARSDHDRKNWPAEPRDWESVIAEIVFRDGAPVQVHLTPISLGYGLKRPDRGYPTLADAATGNKILERLKRISQPYGTTIAIENGLGVISLPQNAMGRPMQSREQEAH
jgi:poly-gamma-glutamate capsule biosynthesis protein CapA/YwtB (metallophosphatase superfamily)